MITKYGEAPWILQAMEVVRGGVQTAIEQLSGQSVPGNMASFREGAGYVLPARTAAEIKDDMAARRQAQPQQFAQVFAEEAADQDDVFARLSRSFGMPPVDPEVQQEVEHETAGQPDVSGEMPWVF